MKVTEQQGMGQDGLNKTHKRGKTGVVNKGDRTVKRDKVQNCEGTKENLIQYSSDLEHCEEREGGTGVTL